MTNPKIGTVHYMTDSFGLVGTPVKERRYVFFDIGIENPDSFKKTGAWKLYELLRTDNRIIDGHSRDIVIEGKPNAIYLGPNAILGERVIIRSDETEQKNKNETPFYINGMIGEGSVFHSKNNHIDDAYSAKYVTFHGSSVGKEARIGTRSVLDNESKIPEECVVGDCCYIDHPVKEKEIRSGTIYFGKEPVLLPKEAIKMQIDWFHNAFVAMKTSSAKEHFKFIEKGIGYFDPLAFMRIGLGQISDNAKNIYVGPFACVQNCEFRGPNINIQDHNYREATVFYGDNIGAHGVFTQNVIMREGAATLFHAMLVNVVLGRGSVAAPLATIIGKWSDKKIEIPDGMVAAGYITPDNIDELIEKGEARDEKRNLTATLRPIEDYDGLQRRLYHINKENAEVHAKKKSNLIAVPAHIAFNQAKREEAFALKKV